MKVEKLVEIIGADFYAGVPDSQLKALCDYLMNTYTGEELHAEYVQLGHHGNNSFPTYFYDYVNPEIALFDSPEWLMTGENYTAKDLKQYFLDKNITCYDYVTAPNSFIFR